MHRSLILLALVSATTQVAADDKAPFGLESHTKWTTSRVVGTPDPPLPYTVERAFPNLKFNGPVFIAQEPGTERFMVGERDGKIFAFTKETASKKECQLFLDIKRELYAFSFHPKYQQNGQVFTFSPQDPKDKSKEKQSRVSRFVATGDEARRCDPKSETIIIEWLAGGHNGGEAIIGPDGYLYIGTGDSTSGSDPKATGQGVNDLLSVMMRLDVDNPSEGRAYSIPKDNPFVNYPGARPEIWAFGFRNPWRFSFDAKTKELWVGDVGQDLWEMIWIVQKGGNYGWSVQEGTHPFHPNNPVGPGPILPPVVEHHHSVCRSITGGYVYYGKKFPELNGVYVYGDYEYGMIWGVKAKNRKSTWQKTLANTALRIASFGVSRDGEILMLDHPSGEIHRLARADTKARNQPFPQTLSETGLFSSTEQHQPAPGLIPYSVNAPQWVDDGTKQRFIAVPGDAKIGFADDRWTFDDGSVLMETISLEMEKGDPSSKRRIETRILVKQENHWLGYSYLWNDTQTEATLVGGRGHEVALKIKDGDAVGGERTQVWRIPSRNECMFCHSRAAGFVLGIRTPQLNKTHHYIKATDNQIRTLNHIGVFKKPVTKKIADLKTTPQVYNSKQDIAERARAYLHVNCSICHVADGGGNAKFDAKRTTAFKDAKLDSKPIHGDFGLTDAQLIKPGDPYNSVLFYRFSKWGLGRMPHIGSNLHDERGVKLLHDWISSLDPSDKTKESVATRLLKNWGKLTASQRAERTRTAIAKTSDALELSFLLSSQSSTVQTAVASIAVKSSDNNARDLFERFLPIEKRVKRLGSFFDLTQLLEVRGNIGRGRELFYQSTASQCKNCHQVRGEGGMFGPDLSEIGKKSRQDILESIVYPSRRIEEKFRSVSVITTKGKAYSGLLESRSDEQTVIKVLTNGQPQIIRIAADDIDEIKPQQNSLMPNGLLSQFTRQQAADLLAYLESLKTK